MFKEIFEKLCAEKGESPSAVCQKVGLSNAAYSAWTENSIPRKATLKKIADYFGVPETFFNDESPKDTLNTTAIIITKKYKKTRNSIIVSESPTVICEISEFNDSIVEDEDSEPFCTPTPDLEEETPFDKVFAQSYIDYLNRFEQIPIFGLNELAIQKILEEALKKCREISTKNYSNGTTRIPIEYVMTSQKIFGDDYSKETASEQKKTVPPLEKLSALNKLSGHEQNLINAYRLQPKLQADVDQLLGIENDEMINVYQAALSEDNHPDGITQMKKKRWDEISGAPETDDPLI